MASPSAPLVTAPKSRPAGEAEGGHSYFPAVDGLRAVAVIAVLLYHLNERFVPGGFVGVDIFFVISGFVVTMSVAKWPVSGVLDFQARFYARRVIRIVPALLVVLAVTSTLFVLFIPKSWLSNESSMTGLAAFFGLSNVALAFSNNDYFSPKATFNPFTHTWSLGVEEQFYFVFPIVLFLLHKLDRKGARALTSLWLVGGLCLASLALCAWLTPHAWRHAFYMLPARFWELGTGMLLALCHDPIKAWLSARKGQVEALGAASVLAILGGLVVSPGSSFPFPFALAPVAGAAGLILAVTASPEGLLARGLGARPVTFVGQISYSLYLWHWPVYVLMRWTVGLETAIQYLIAVVLAFGLAILSYRLIEQPTRRSARLKSMPRGGIVLAAVLVVTVCAGSAGALMKFKETLTLSRTRQAEIWYPDGGPALDGDRCRLDRAQAGFLDGVAKTIKPQGCPAKDVGRLIVVGDSHATAYDRMLERFALAQGREVWIYDRPGCNFLGLRKPMRDEEVGCRRFQGAVVAALAREVGPDDIVFLPSLRVPRFKDQWGDVAVAPAGLAGDEDRAGAEQEAAEVLRRLTARGGRVVFEAPKPIFKSPPFRCADWFNTMNPVCRDGFVMPRAELETLRAPAVATMRRIALANPRVVIWDPLPVLCSGSECDAFRGAQPLFFDGDHISGYGGDVLLPSFSSALGALWRGGSSGNRSSQNPELKS
jgi:peptidoglycan/LPS O-acetylase OafA/YrhL